MQFNSGCVFRLDVPHEKKIRQEEAIRCAIQLEKGWKK